MKINWKIFGTVVGAMLVSIIISIFSTISIYKSVNEYIGVEVILYTPDGEITVEQSCKLGDSYELSVLPKEGYYFKGWKLSKFAEDFDSDDENFEVTCKKGIVARAYFDKGDKVVINGHNIIAVGENVTIDVDQANNKIQFKHTTEYEHKGFWTKHDTDNVSYGNINGILTFQDITGDATYRFVDALDHAVILFENQSTMGSYYDSLTDEIIEELIVQGEIKGIYKLSNLNEGDVSLEIDIDSYTYVLDVTYYVDGTDVVIYGEHTSGYNGFGEVSYNEKMAIGNKYYNISYRIY